MKSYLSIVAVLPMIALSACNLKKIEDYDKTRKEMDERIDKIKKESNPKVDDLSFLEHGGQPALITVAGVIVKNKRAC